MTQSPLRVIDGHGERRGWQEIWDKDVWTQDEVPHGDLASKYRGTIRINFGKVVQPWLKEAAKRWARDRLLAGINPSSMSHYLNDVAAFSAWLSGKAPEVQRPADLSRPLIEDYLLWLRKGSGWASQTIVRRAVTLRALLDEQAEDSLKSMPRSVRIIRGEIPKKGYKTPPLMEAGVFEQFIDLANLDLIKSQLHRTVILLLAFTGFRVSSIVTVTHDCLRKGPDEQDYLAYENVKSAREALLPIPPQLAVQIRAQNEDNKEVHGRETSWLLPSPKKYLSRAAGENHISHTTLGRIVNRYIERADIRNPDGTRAKVNPHMFRHNLGTTLVNDGVSLTVIQHVLDHSSSEMTNLYAHLHDGTVRDAMKDWHERVNHRGERIGLATDGPMAIAQWMKESISRAKQSLSNGWCGLPLIQTCPHPNACLTCDNFLTDESFRPVHEQQREHNGSLLSQAHKNGNIRLVEILEKDQASLDTIIGALDSLKDESPPETHSDFDLRDLDDRPREAA